LYLAGCPHREPALRQLRAILSEQGVAASIAEILVADQPAAEALNFPGSPTIRINGNDVEPAALPRSDGLSCRTYLDEGRPVGVPPPEMIRRAIQTATGGLAQT
jgi:hypothetical protein